MNELSLPGTPSQRIRLLYHRETAGLPWPDWKNWPGESASEEATLREWRDSIRPFSFEEFAGCTWVKTCSQGYITELQFQTDGTVEEHTLFERVHVPGDWQISDKGTLQMVLRTPESRYQIESFASRTGAIHSAVEFQDGVVHAYLKLMRLAAD